MSKILFVVLGVLVAWMQSGPGPEVPAAAERVSEARGMSSRGDAYFRQNNLDSAAYYLDSANKLINKYNIRDTALVQETKNTYGIVLAYLQRNAESIRIFEELNTFYRKIDESPEIKTKRARVFNNIAINYNFLSDYEQSIRYFDSCLVIFKEKALLHDKQTQTLYLNKALNHLDLGDYQSAIENVELSRHIRGADPGAHDGGYALMRENLIYGEVLIEINQNKADLLDAVKHLEEGLEILISMNPEDYYKGSFLGLLSKAHFLLGDYDNAARYAGKTHDFYISSYGENYTGLIFRYNEFAKILAAQGKTDSAYRYLSKALAIPVNADANKTMYKVQALLQMADLRAGEQVMDSIPAYLSRAEALLFPGYADTASVLSNPPSGLIPSHPFMGAFFTRKGSLLHQLYVKNMDLRYLKQALECYIIAITEGGRSRKGLMTLRSKAAFSNLLQDNFSQAMILAHVLYETTGLRQDFQKILWISDQSKSAMLKEHLQGGDATLGIPPEVRTEELELKSKIIRLEQAMYSQSAANQMRPDSGASLLAGELLAAKLAFDVWLRTLENNYPNYRRIMYGNSYSEAADESLRVAEHGLKDRVIIDYFDSKELFYIQYVTRDRRGAIAVHKSAELMDALSYVRNALTEPGATGNYQQSAKIVFDHLLQPVLQQVSAGKILIVPDGILSHIPFEALVDGITPSAQGYSEYQFLIHRYRFSYHHALSLLNPGQRARTHARSVFAMAPVYDAHQQLSQLPNTAKEVSLIREIFPGQYRYGADATESSLKQLVDESDIIHLAAHSVVNNRNPMKSHLVLMADTMDDGLLHTYELLSMRFNADLICLSACNSGSGELQHGEGIMSLARGFMYADVANILMSLWAVPDRATGDIMKSFYSELKAGKSYDDAIHQAKLSYLLDADEHLANPFYWAAFVYMGNVEENISIATLWWVLGVSGIAGLAIWVFIMRRRKVSSRE